MHKLYCLQQYQTNQCKVMPFLCVVQGVVSHKKYVLHVHVLLGFFGKHCPSKQNKNKCVGTIDKNCSSLPDVIK